MNDVIIMKSEIRQWIRKERRELSSDWVSNASRRVQERTVTLSEYESARAVGAYFALPSEVQTAKLLERCWHDGKEVCVPAFDPAQGAYTLARADAGCALKKGELGIFEPAVRSSVEADALQLIFVPGLAFDMYGGRLGHGAGHYDAMLRGAIGVFKIGLAFDFQLVDRIPMASADVSMNAIVTNTKVIRVDDNENGSKS